MDPVSSSAPSGRRRRRPFVVAVAIATAVTAALAFVVVAHDDGTRTEPQPPEVTLEAALAAFGSATDLFLKIPGIEGESLSERHPNEIPVANVSWGLVNPNGTPAAATLTDVTITKGVDRASPKLFTAAGAGTQFFVAAITADKPGASPFTFVRLNLLAARVVSFNQVANHETGFDEKLTMRASAIQLVYTVQRPDGSSGGNVTGCWNVLTHAAC